MTDLEYRELPAVLRPLLNKFYRAHQPSMQAASGDRLWVARRGDIQAALCLRPLTDEPLDCWLTGLLVAPLMRGQRVASQLVTQACQQAQGTVWLFCQPGLAVFYERLGFARNEQLPPELAGRLARYRRHKPLLALGRAPGVD